MSEPNKTSIKLRLSDTQLIALSSTSQREGGAVTLPDRIKGAAAVNLISSLVAKGLVCETPADGGMPVARRDEEGRPFALVITGLGRASINASEEVSANRNQEDEATETQIGAPSSSNRRHLTSRSHSSAWPRFLPPRWRSRTAHRWMLPLANRMQAARLRRQRQRPACRETAANWPTSSACWIAPMGRAWTT
jgi:hypothetical protein